MVVCIAELAFAQIPEYVPGTSYWGKNHFVEYVAGNLPVIISVPHGGSLKPEIVADRTFGEYVKDLGTQEIVREMIAEFRMRTGKYPHVILSHLARRKVDVNREEFEGAQDTPAAVTAWNEYHGFIDSARSIAGRNGGMAVLIDLHGHNHTEARIEIGYRLEYEDLVLADSVLNTGTYCEKSSLKNLVKRSSRTHAELIRGPQSLGALFDASSVPSTPSPSRPDPGTYKFFGGGYTVNRHTVEDTSAVFGVQFELDPGHRAPERCQSTSSMLVRVIIDYLTVHCGDDLSARMK